MVGEGDGAGFGVECDVLPADFVAQGVEFGLGGDAALMEEESPGSEKWADGDVECAVGDAAPVEGALEEAEGFGVGDDGGGGGLAGDAGEFAGRAVVAEEGFEAVDLFE